IGIFQVALDDNQIKAIWFARGGYGSIQLASLINWSNFAENPKWLIGFSDVTVWHSLLQQQGFMSLHAAMPSTFNDTESQAINKAVDLLKGEVFKLEVENHPFNFLEKEISGVLWGGNLSIIVSMLGSIDFHHCENGILCIEDVGEYLYHIDRMMYQLRRSKILEKSKALLVGGFSEMNDNSTPFGENAYEIIKRHAHELRLPVVFDAPFGHIRKNYPLIFGLNVNLNRNQDRVVLQELS
ncbi:MAG: LD-carboxypeptidase, partial [Cytophagales bacterium]